MPGADTQTPLVAYGLAEAIDIFFIQELRVLFQYYTNQQNESKEVEIEALWNKVQSSGVYPFVGVMTHIPRYEPVFISDIIDGNDPPGLFTGTINHALIGLHIETAELRELARVREFIYLNLEKGNHPITQIPWLHWLQQNNIVLNYFDNSEPEQMNFSSIQLRTQRAQGMETMERTDIETLWYQDIDICADVAFNVQMLTNNGVINGITLTMEPDYNLVGVR